MPRSRSGGATIEDVAALAGVSRAAVSKVIRNAYGVSPAMRERVGEAIQQLSYRPRVAARAMRGSTYTIGFEVPDLKNQFFSRVLSGASAALADTDYQMILAPANVNPLEPRAVEALLDHQVDGLVAIAPLVEPAWLDDVARRVPVVMFGRHDRSDLYDSVVSDDELGARVAMRHLLELGHEAIAHLTIAESATRPYTPHGVRVRVYEEEMRRSGHGALAEVLRVDIAQEFARETVLERLARRPRPTAIFAGHDELALGAMSAAAEAGVELSIVGYDGVAIAAHPLVSLTTVDQHGEAMGARSMELLLERIKGRTTAVHEVVEPILRHRSSTRAR